MFYPQLFGIIGEVLVSAPSLHYDDAEDLFDDKQLLEVRKTVYVSCVVIASGSFLYL